MSFWLELALKVLVITAIARTPTEDLFPPGTRPAPEGSPSHSTGPRTRSIPR